MCHSPLVLFRVSIIFNGTIKQRWKMTYGPLLQSYQETVGEGWNTSLDHTTIRASALGPVLS
jgi:hypothetical protein